jgi:heme-degrading monooxygenase HmoA
MIAVIFEALPHAGRKDGYLDAAARLKPLLEKMDGFRLRVTQVIRDYGLSERDQAPEDSRAAHR